MNYLAIPYAIIFTPFYMFWIMKIFDVERPVKTWVIYYFAAALSMGLPTLILPHNTIRWFSIMVMLMLCTFIVLRVSIWKSIVYIVAIDLLLVFAEFFLVLIMVIVDQDYFMNQVKTDGVAVNIIMWVVSLAFTTIVYFIKRIKGRKHEIAEEKEKSAAVNMVIFAIIYCCIYSIVVYYLLDVLTEEALILISNFSIWVWLLGGFVPILSITGASYMFADKKRAQRHLDEILELQKSSFALYENSREFVHDYKNLMLYFQGCIESGDYEKLKNVVSEKLADAQVVYNSSYKMDLNSIEDTGIRYILVSKTAEAVKNGVTFEVASFENVDTVMKKNEFIEILGILTDNAIESAVQSEKKKIVLSLKKLGSGYELSVSNTYGEKPVISKLFERDYTTKEGHSGIGLNKVKKICDKYDELYLNAAVSDGVFAISISKSDNA